MLFKRVDKVLETKEEMPWDKGMTC
jgi:hypothetical protein